MYEVTGYAIGFLLCIIALSLMKTGQPALLYLVPSTLGPFVVSSLIRGEFLIVWRGKKDTGDKIVLVSIFSFFILVSQWHFYCYL